MLIFSKAPGCKEAKSRLRTSSGLTSQFVSALHDAFVADTLDLASKMLRREDSAKATVQRVMVAWYPDVPHAIDSQLSLEPSPHEGIRQVGNSFGDRLQHAIDTAFLSCQSNLIIIGTDCPLISPDLIGQTCRHLGQDTVTLGPSTEGGIYLIGIPWSQRSVKLSRCFRDGVELLDVAAQFDPHPTVLLPPLWDIDIESDLVSLVAWLNTAKLTQKTERDLELYLPQRTTELLRRAEIYQDSGENRSKKVRLPPSLFS